jgi:hypothetical protein
MTEDRDLLYERFGRLGSGAEPWLAILKRDPCAYCGQRTHDITVDHITPFAALPPSSRTGSEAGRWARWRRQESAGLSNGAPACSSCNTAKADSSLLGYLARRLPSQLEVAVVRAARKKANRMLCCRIPRAWWDAVGLRLASGAAQQLEDGRFWIYASSNNGCLLRVVLRADMQTFRGHIHKVTITGFGLAEDE